MALPQDDVTFPHTPERWDLEADFCYIFMGQSPSIYPPASYFPGMEEDKENFQGGVSLIYLLRYKNTAVGVYDELVFVPGSFAYGNKEKKDSALRVTNIFVNSRHSLQEGRRIWGFPKHLANFEWTELNPYETHLKVTLPNSSHSIFSVTLQKSRWIPSIPAASFILPSSLLNIVHVPIAITSEEQENDKKIKFSLSWKGWAKPAYISGEGGDGIHLPKFDDLKHLWKVGLFIQPMNLVLSAPTTITYK